MPAFDPNAAALPDSGVFGLPFTPEEAKVVLVPVPYEATTSYGGGTADGPEAILEASKQVDLFDLDTGKPYDVGISMLPMPGDVRAWNDEAKKLAAPIVESGGLDVNTAALAKVNALSEKMNDWVYQTTKHWLAEGKIVGVVGGDHSTPVRLHQGLRGEVPASWACCTSTLTPICATPTRASPGRTRRSCST